MLKQTSPLSRCLWKLYQINDSTPILSTFLKSWLQQCSTQTASTDAYQNSNDYLECFETLNIDSNCDQSTARDAFLKLAKKYHPDSGHQLASSIKFQEIKFAYEKILEKFQNDRKKCNACEGEFGLYYQEKEEEEPQPKDHGKVFDIEHTAPQHRQYLDYEGIGFGTPSQREKQYTKFRAMRAAEHVMDFKVKQFQEDSDETALSVKDRKAAKKIRTRYGIDRIVEDKIQESMAKGDFDNLPNAGKPLKYKNHNPFVDSVTFKLNEVLINNGYAPEWVTLEKEIRDMKSSIKESLVKKCAHLGPYPLSLENEILFEKFLTESKKTVRELNRKIDKYNFLTPIMAKQMSHLSMAVLSSEIRRLRLEIAEVPLDVSSGSSENVISKSNFKEGGGFRSIISLFKGS